MHHDLSYGFTLTVTGLIIVFAVLSLIALILGLVKRVDERWQRAEARDEAARLDRPPTLDATTAVLLAAAVATYLGGRARIRSVRRVLPPDAPSSPWSTLGRAVLQGSHVIARKRPS